MKVSLLHFITLKFQNAVLVIMTFHKDSYDLGEKKGIYLKHLRLIKKTIWKGNPIDWGYRICRCTSAEE